MDLFGPCKTTDAGNKYVLTMTDACTKYAESVALRLNLEWAYVYHVHFPSWLNGKALLAPPDRNSRNEVCISPVKGRLVKGSIQ